MPTHATTHSEESQSKRHKPDEAGEGQLIELCKQEESFRNYVDSARHALVFHHYKEMRSKQVCL
jgi:hypothetical protein